MTIKSKLLGKNRRIAKKLAIELDGEKVEVAICKPTMGDRARVLAAAKAAGEITEAGEPTNQEKAVRMTARVVAATLFDADTKQRLFTDADLDALLEEDWLDDVLPDCQAVFTPDTETVKGK